MGMMEKIQETAPEPAVTAPEKPQPGPWAVSIGGWVHRNKDLTDHLGGYTLYQYLRSAAAGIPYGISMPTTWYGMHKLAQAGERMQKAGEAAGSAWKSAVGMNLHKFASAKPVVASAMIGTSFTFYRGTSKMGNWVRQHLFDPNDTQDQTIEKVQYFWTDLRSKFHEISPAEIHSTPVAAIVLGFMTSAFDIGKVPEELRWLSKDNISKAVKTGTRMGFMRDVIMNPKARFIEQAAINTFGYSLFFELGDRLYKDKQLERRLWQGDPNNISNKEGSADPSASLADDEETERQRIINKFGKKLHHGQVKRAEPSDKKYGFFTDEPSLGRFLFRRVLPTSLGITAYTALKMRQSYMWLGGPFPDIRSARDIPKNIWREGAAVSLFFLIPWVSDPWSRIYDNFFAKLEGKAKEPPEAPSPQIIENNEKLLSKLNEKERGALSR